MAIPFAATRYIQRSRAHSALERLAYILRSSVWSERTSKRFDYSDRERPIATGMLLPIDAPQELQAPEALWNAVELASKLENASLGIDLLIALPAAGELDDELAVELVRRFIHRFVVEPHGLGATFAIHRPHRHLESRDLALERGDLETDDRFSKAMALGDINIHAHILITPRQVLPTGLARLRYTNLDVRHVGGATGLDWGRLWGRYQDAFFYEQGLDLRVRPNPPSALVQLPLNEVRQMRKVALARDPRLKGRSLIVAPVREDINRDALATITGAIECFTSPFTRRQLADLFERYWPHESSSELSLAAIGLGDAVSVELPIGSNDEWFAPLHLAKSELACLGRVLMLASRRLGRLRDLPAIGTGFPVATARLLESIAAANDIVLIEVNGPTSSLSADLTWLAQQIGQVPVAVLHGGGNPVPKAVTRTLQQLQRKPVSRALIVLEEPDALTARELDLILEASVAGKNQLVFIRQQSTVWPRSQLIDMLAVHMPQFRWTHSAISKSPDVTPLSLSAMLQEFAERGGLTFVSAEEIEPDKLLSSLENRASLPGLVVPTAELRNRLRALSLDAGLPLSITSVADENPASEIIVPVTDQSVRVIPEILRTSRNKGVEFLVPITLANSPDELAQVIRRSCMPTSSVTCRPVFAPSKIHELRHEAPFFAVTAHEEIGTREADICDSLTFWTTAPTRLAWKGYIRAHRREASELRLALQDWLGTARAVRPEESLERKTSANAGAGSTYSLTLESGSLINRTGQLVQLRDERGGPRTNDLDSQMAKPYSDPEFDQSDIDEAIADRIIGSGSYQSDDGSEEPEDSDFEFEDTDYDDESNDEEQAEPEDGL